jgi:hypothetical protein
MKTTEQINMPDLRLLPSEALVLHEHADDKRVTRLANRLRTDGFLKNPPIVAPIPGTDQYVVLDGANRTSAVKRLGYPHVLVQVVDYASEHVRLLSWYHLIIGRNPIDFLQGIAQVPGLTLKLVDLKTAREALHKRMMLAYVAVPADGVYSVNGLPGTERHGTQASNDLLNALVDTYKSDPLVAIHRSSTDDVDALVDYYDNISGLVVFQPYTPRDIIKLAKAGTKVPTGITRHLISYRALRVNGPTALLSGPQSIEEKNTWWHEQFKHKLAANEVRLYQESTYLFDE